jgi:hypothetical protein
MVDLNERGVRRRKKPEIPAKTYSFG